MGFRDCRLYSYSHGRRSLRAAGRRVAIPCTAPSGVLSSVHLSITELARPLHDGIGGAWGTINVEYGGRVTGGGCVSRRACIACHVMPLTRAESGREWPTLMRLLTMCELWTSSCACANPHQSASATFGRHWIRSQSADPKIPANLRPAADPSHQRRTVTIPVVGKVNCRLLYGILVFKHWAYFIDSVIIKIFLFGNLYFHLSFRSLWVAKRNE